MHVTLGSYIKDYPTQEAAEKDKHAEFNAEVYRLQENVASSKKNRNIAIAALAIAAIAVVGIAIVSGTFLPLTFVAILVIPAVFIYIHHKAMLSYASSADLLTQSGHAKINNLEYAKDRGQKQKELSDASPEHIRDCGLSVEEFIGYRLLDNSSAPNMNDKIVAFYNSVPELVKALRDNKENAAQNFNEARAKIYA